MLFDLCLYVGIFVCGMVFKDMVLNKLKQLKDGVFSKLGI